VGNGKRFESQMLWHHPVIVALRPGRILGSLQCWDGSLTFVFAFVVVCQLLLGGECFCFWAWMVGCCW